MSILHNIYIHNSPHTETAHCTWITTQVEPKKHILHSIQTAYDSSQLNPVAWFSSVQLDKHAIFIVLAQIKQVSGVGGLASLAIKDYILQF